MAHKTKKKPPETYATYIFEITDWGPNYHLSANQDTREERLYWEHASIQISAVCVFPAKFVGNASQLELVGDRNLLHPEILKYDKAWKPRCMGTLTARDERLEFYGSVPYDAVFGIAGMLDRWRFAILHGSVMRHRKSLSRSIYFQRTVNLDDY